MVTKPEPEPSVPASTEEILDEQQAGRQAALNGTPVSDCPHRLNGRETAAEAARTRFLQLMWLRGYRHAQAQMEATRPDQSAGGPTTQPES